MKITYKNKTIETLHYEEITEEQRALLQKQFFEKPDFSQVIQQFHNVSKNGVMIDKITKYYFRDIMAKTLIKGCKWTVEDVFNSKELLGIFVAKTKTNPSVFDSANLITNIDTAIRLGGGSIAKFPTNFPINTARMILNKYNINNNWYDFSCGWGVRLLAALTGSINYFGTDPNFLLTEKLIQLYNDYKNNINNSVYAEIKMQGSETFIYEWENKIGLAFSSPPYFDVEDYKIGNQSYTDTTSYEAWKNNYLIPTIQNIHHYLITDGIFALNIKNNKRNNLADDSKELILKNKFELINIEILTNNQRNTPSGLLNNSENIFIFKKKPLIIYNIPNNFNIETNLQINDLIYDEYDFDFKDDEINEPLKQEQEQEEKEKTSNILIKNIDIYLIGVKSKKQLNDINIYNSNNKFLGERYFSTFTSDLLKEVNFLSNYEIEKYIEISKKDVIELLNYNIFHKDINNSFKNVIKLCEIVDSWNEMEENNFHLFLQIENSN